MGQSGKHRHVCTSTSYERVNLNEEYTLVVLKSKELGRWCAKTNTQLLTTRQTTLTADRFTKYEKIVLSKNKILFWYLFVWEICICVQYKNYHFNSDSCNCSTSKCKLKIKFLALTKILNLILLIIDFIKIQIAYSCLC